MEEHKGNGVIQKKVALQNVWVNELGKLGVKSLSIFVLSFVENKTTKNHHMPFHAK